MSKYSERLGLLVEAAMVRELAGRPVGPRQGRVAALIEAARAKAMGEAADPTIKDTVVDVVDPKLSMKEAQAALKEYGLPRVHPMATGSRKWFKLDAVADGLKRLQRDKRFKVREAGVSMGESVEGSITLVLNSLERLERLAPAALKQIRSSIEKVQADVQRNAPQIMNASKALSEMQSVMDGLKRRIAQLTMEAPE